MIFNKKLIIGLVVGGAVLLVLYYSTRTLSFEYDVWRENKVTWLGETRYRMRNYVFQELEVSRPGEEVADLLGVPDRGGVEQGFFTYRLGRHRKFLGLLSDTYWLTIILRDGNIEQAYLHPD